VEESLAIDWPKLCQAGALREGASGLIWWDRGEEIVANGYWRRGKNADRRLDLDVAIRSNERILRVSERLEFVRCAQRTFLLCPACGRRRAKLYVSVGGERIGNTINGSTWHAGMPWPSSRPEPLLHAPWIRC
jgi:hypothetical protein